MLKGAREERHVACGVVADRSGSANLVDLREAIVGDADRMHDGSLLWWYSIEVEVMNLDFGFGSCEARLLHLRSDFLLLMVSQKTDRQQRLYTIPQGDYRSHAYYTALSIGLSTREFALPSARLHPLKQPRHIPARHQMIVNPHRTRLGEIALFQATSTAVLTAATPHDNTIRGIADRELPTQSLAFWRAYSIYRSSRISWHSDGMAVIGEHSQQKSFTRSTTGPGPSGRDGLQLIGTGETRCRHHDVCRQ
nr:hypothetical protein CFP56_19323 [Quercus suber]